VSRVFRTLIGAERRLTAAVWLALGSEIQGATPYENPAVVFLLRDHPIYSLLRKIVVIQFASHYVLFGQMMTQQAARKHIEQFSSGALYFRNQIRGDDQICIG
jgi:hypothetical protein